MLYLKELRENPDRLSDLLPWAALVAPGVVLNKDGSLQSTIRFRGPDLDSATEGELLSVTARLNNALMRLGSGWAIYVEAQRRRSIEYPICDFPDPLSALIDEERRRAFSGEAHFESVFFLTLQYLPSVDAVSRFSSRFVQGAAKQELNYTQVLESFQTETQKIARLLHDVIPEVVVLTDEETLSYLHSTISPRSHRVRCPQIPMYLDALLVDSDLTTGFDPRLSELELGIITVNGFPTFSTPGLLDDLNRLSLEYRWMTRFILMDKVEATRELSTLRRKWFAKRKSVVTHLKEVMTGQESMASDADALRRAEDADQALQSLSADECAYGYFTATVVLMDRCRETLNANIREVERVINGLGFTTIHERVNAVDAFLGTVPGNARNNVRRPILNTTNLAHIMPVSAVWAGPLKNKHLNGAPLFYARTGGATPFRLVNHVGDVGHTTVIGPTGAGKSVLLGFMALQFLRYKNAQVYIFDKGGSARAITYAVGGDHYDLGVDGEALSFQPLRGIETESERRWAHEWVAELVTQQGLALRPEMKAEMWRALGSLSTAPLEQRTLFGLTNLVQDNAIKEALTPYTIEGAYGNLLDNKEDNLRAARFQTFEMERLMESKGAVLPVLTYLFHQLEKRFTGDPTLLILDEAWLFLDNDAFSGKIREWLKVLRKANVSVIFATQSLTDIDQSKIAPTIREACLTKIYLPNAAAYNPDIGEIYRKFGLNERQIQILAQSTPKRHYYYTSQEGNRLFDLALDAVALAYVGATSKEEQLRVEELKNRTTSVDEFNEAFLRSKNLNEEAEFFTQFRKFMRCA
jgi:type IV secretion/conjugal transfer VirB4 family ATPase